MSVRAHLPFLIALAVAAPLPAQDEASTSAPKPPPGMRWVPAGAFTMGWDGDEGKDYAVQTWDARTRARQERWSQLPGMGVTCLAFDRQGRLAVGTRDQRIRIYDAEGMRELSGPGADG